mmetsp:Transcript_116461/g.324553  ORF Transcript_116461/g.324553 Transcript_116461/m.324553 type:complete len:359 (+) Transcript_116461:72-1148(+)|eukprot:CAMPEP_0179056528 /NCGR_PEP_ID=MMETSP0796-20121207/23857_1 /TAXON_ID=73915 /ORGANISM="Pyrodinium bahamense, Strain pbaha01" /LENGTH=358 /DNA_ID=CAMNT_0020753203 /DNA_START=72 /DNA_END=1148 /DNA_ORIENTATION=-
MIGLVMRSVMGESLGLCGMIVGPLLAIAAVCGIMQCCKCRMRDCACIKRLLRVMGTDPFDDFEMMILVHRVSFTASSKQTVYVRVKAGDHVVSTDPSGAGLFQQALCIFIEQGTQDLIFQLLSTSDKVLAELKMNVMKEVLKDEDGIPGPDRVIEKTFVMKQKDKHVLNPRITLTFAPEGPGEEEKALLSGLNASSETEWMLQQQLAKVSEEEKRSRSKEEGAAAAAGEQLSEIALLAKGCCGPLERFGTLGKKLPIYVGVQGPPRRKKFALHIWDSEKEFRADQPSKESIELLRISSVAPDPGRPEVFIVSYVDKEKQPQKATFQRLDRNRDVWVELLQILVTKVHEDHDEKKRHKK